MAKQLQIGVKALFLNNDKKVLLIKRSGSTGAPKDIWDIPGGRIKLGEEPEVGLHREIEEEIGTIKFHIIKPIQVKSRVNDTKRQIVRVTYLCKFSEGTINLSDEHDDFGWFDWLKLPTKVDNLTKEAIISVSKNKDG